MFSILLRIERKACRVITGIFPGRFPQLYSTLDAPMEVPVQVAAYRLATRKYIQPGDRVLDVGFGLCYGMKIISENASEVVGIEIDRSAVKHGMNIIGASSKVKEVIHYDGYNIPYPDNSFDVVVCIDVLEHVPDYMRLLRDMCRVSRRVVLISTPQRRPEYTRPDGRPKNRWHLREWSSDELESILKQIPDVCYEWNFINGPWKGPFEISQCLADNTLALAPALFFS